jgi:hydrogenase nickel incorporation protein HypA/HybF
VHELSLAQEMVEMLSGVVREQHARRVTEVRLRVGELSCVDPEALSFSFEIACRGTPLEGSRLVVAKVPLRIRCRACGWEGGSKPEDGCPGCQALGFDVLAGREIKVESIDVDE